MKPKTDKQGWEEEFDNKVKEMPKKLIELVEWNKIKDFIRLQREEARREGVEIGLGQKYNDQLDIQMRYLEEAKKNTKSLEKIAEILSKLTLPPGAGGV